MTWVIREGKEKGKGQHLWGLHRPERHGNGSIYQVDYNAWWGTQAGAYRYTDRSYAVRDASRVQGRVVRLLSESVAGEKP